jgi:hypothetical protein
MNYITFANFTHGLGKLMCMNDDQESGMSKALGVKF